MGDGSEGTEDIEMDACKLKGAVSDCCAGGASGVTSTGDDILSGVETADWMADDTRRESRIGGGWARLRADH